MINDDGGSTTLAQSRPSGTSATQVYSPPANRRAVIYKIIISNTTAIAAAASVYLDDDGTTYDQTTSVLYERPIPGNESESMEFEDGWEIATAANIAVKTGTASALTFTVLGRELDVR